MLKSIAAFGAAALLSIMSIGPASAGIIAPELPTVTLQETVDASGGEYTITIDSPATQDWFIALFAVGAAESNGTSIDDENPGHWISTLLTPEAWNLGFAFEFDAPGGNVELITSTELGLFEDLFGDDSVANIYWAGLYTDYSIPGGSLIGADETRGGFFYQTSIAASNFIALLNDGVTTVRGVANVAALPEPGTLGLFGLGLVGLGLAMRRRKTA